MAIMREKISSFWYIYDATFGDLEDLRTSNDGKDVVEPV